METTKEARAVKTYEQLQKSLAREDGLVAKNKLLKDEVKRLEKIITCAIDGIDALPPSWDEEAENKLAAIKIALKET